MGTASTTSCPNCERLQKRMQAMEELVASLTAQVRLLQEKLAAAGKNSSTSSKPPSSDIVKPPKPDPPPGQDQRPVGGQAGHPRHERAPFPPERIDGGIHLHTIDCCPDCGHATRPLDAPPRVIQQMDLRTITVVVEEHRGSPVWCPRCLKMHYAPLPASVEQGGLVGPGLTALIAYLKGPCHASFGTIRKFLRDVAGVSISRGQLSKVIHKVSEALADPYEELLRCLPGEGRVNADETGHKDKGRKLWTWCFRAGLYTLFRIDPYRNTDVLIEVLGKEFEGVLCCDFFSSYRCYMRQFDVAVQFCLAHLTRDVKFLTTLPDIDAVIYGTRLVMGLERLFGVIHRRGQLSEAEFAGQLQAAKASVLEAGTLEVPDSGPCRTMAKRLAKYGEAYFTFLTTPGVEPTNNLAEQAIRFVVLDRVVTQGTRGVKGQRWCERIWTVIATCAQQGRSVFEYLQEAVRAHFGGEEVASLLPQAD